MGMLTISSCLIGRTIGGLDVLSRKGVWLKWRCSGKSISKGVSRSKEHNLTISKHSSRTNSTAES